MKTEAKNIHITLAEPDKQLAERLQRLLMQTYPNTEIVSDIEQLQAAFEQETPDKLLIVRLDFYLPDPQIMLDQLSNLYNEEHPMNILALTHTPLTRQQQDQCDIIHITTLTFPYTFTQITDALDTMVSDI